MILHIYDIVDRLLQTRKAKELAEDLEVSTAMVSTWRNRDQDFIPRKEVAARIQGLYGYTAWPYSEIALKDIWDSIVAKDTSEHYKWVVQEDGTYVKVGIDDTV